MDFEDISIPGIIFGVIGFGVAIIVSKQMGSELPLRIISGAVTGLVCYFVGGKLSES